MLRNPRLLSYLGPRSGDILATGSQSDRGLAPDYGSSHASIWRRIQVSHPQISSASAGKNPTLPKERLVVDAN